MLGTVLAGGLWLALGLRGRCCWSVDPSGFGLKGMGEPFCGVWKPMGLVRSSPRFVVRRLMRRASVVSWSSISLWAARRAFWRCAFSAVSFAVFASFAALAETAAALSRAFWAATAFCLAAGEVAGPDTPPMSSSSDDS